MAIAEKNRIEYWGFLLIRVIEHTMIYDQLFPLNNLTTALDKGRERVYFRDDVISLQRDINQ